ncbi:MAG: hypothetical protein ACI4OL_03010 [Gemmiger sp.]
MRKRLLCAVLAAGLLLCSCGSLQRSPQSTGETAQGSVQSAPEEKEQLLNVYYEQSNPAAERALTEYAAAQGVTVSVVQTADEAGLAVLCADPEGADGWRDLSGDALLNAAAARTGTEGSFSALPLGKTLYAYWADRRVLGALLGDGFDLSAMQNATWKEWSDFCTALQSWLDSPAERTVTLSGTAYTLPAAKEGAAAGLTQVFAIPEHGFGGAALSGTLVAAGGQRTRQALTGPLNGLANCFALELANGGAGIGTPGQVLAGEGAAQAVFYRGPLCDFTAALGADACQELVMTPQKCYFTADDLSTDEYNVAGLTNYPVAASAGYFAVPAAADEESARAGMSFLLWLYTSTEGEVLLTDGLVLVTPWNTASDATALGAALVETMGSGVVPGVPLSQGENAALEQAAGRSAPLDRKAFVAAACDALGAGQ